MYNQSQNGVICIFSLKNPSYPEYLCWAESGVMCLDFHQQVRGEERGGEGRRGTRGEERGGYGEEVLL